MAVRVVDLLKPSRSRNSSDSGRPVRDARFDFAPQHQIQIPRVVQAGQVVGDRQRLGLLQRRVRYRARWPAARAASGTRARAPGRATGRPPTARIEGDQHADGPVPAYKRKCDRAARRAGDVRLSRSTSPRQNSAPWRMHPVGRHPERGREVRRQPFLRDDRKIAIVITRDHDPAGARNPRPSLVHQPARDLLGFERGISFPDRLDERLPPFELRAQRTRRAP